MSRVCKLCGLPLPDYRRRPYQDCATCETNVLQIATNLHRPAVYNDFLSLRPEGEGSGYWEQIIKELLERHGYQRHRADEKENWTCDFPERWAPQLGMRTHFHSPTDPN